MEQPDFGEVFQKGGIAGVIRKAMDYTNMKWQSKNNRTALAFVGLLGFGGKKLLDRATDGKQKWYQKAGIIAATMFGTEAITGESLFTGIKKLLTGGFSVAALSEQLNQLFTGANGEAPEKAIYLKNLGLLGIIGGTAPMEQFLRRDQQWAQNPQAYAYWRKKNQAILLSPELKELSDATLMEHFNQSFPETYQSGMVENFLAGYGINAATGDQSRKKLTAQQLQDRLVNRNVEMNTWLGQQGKKLKADKVHEVNPYLIREDYLPERTFAQMEAAGFFEADLENNQSNERQDEKARMIDQVDPLASLADTSPQKNKR